MTRRKLDLIDLRLHRESKIQQKKANILGKPTSKFRCRLHHPLVRSDSGLTIPGDQCDTGRPRRRQVLIQLPRSQSISRLRKKRNMNVRKLVLKAIFGRMILNDSFQ